MARTRLIRRSLAFYVAALLLLFFLTDMLLFQYPASRKTSYISSTNSVLQTVDKISSMEKSVLPNQSTVILEPSPGVTCHDSGNGLFILFIVISSPDNIERRDVIRSTFSEMEGRWEEQFQGMMKGRSHNNASEMEVSRVFQLLFFVGQSAEHGMSDEVREEWERHGDVIVDDMQESYLKLTVKTLRMLKWVLHNCANAKYMVKMDDDVFLNVPKLFSILLDQPNGYNPLLVAGHVYDEIAPDRDPSSKWFTPRSLYSAEKLPKFTAGFCYVLGLKAVKEMFEESKNVPLFHLEDVYLTGIVASDRLKLELTDPGGIAVMIFWWQFFRSWDWPQSMLIIHDVPMKKFKCWTKDTGNYGREAESNDLYWPLVLSCLW